MELRETIHARDEALQGFPGQTLPEAMPETLARAERIAAGALFFYGDTQVQVGLRGIDWSGSHIPHQEWPAQLNRFFYLAPLAAAYRHTGDEQFAEAARSYIEDWLDSHGDYRQADRFAPGDSGLNAGIRLGSSHATGWGGALPAFLPSPAFDDAFLEKMLDSMSAQADFLADHLTPWGNWRISELDALVFTALRFPFLPNAEDLLTQGIEGMRAALATQFLPDGVHIERSPGYHEWMADVLASYYDLARRFPEADARVDPAMVVRAFDYAAHDELFGVNDSRAPHRDPDRLRHLARRRSVLGALFPARDFPGEPPREQVFGQAGHVFARSSWEPGADYLAFDASTWGGGHSHLSRLSFTFRAGGRSLVADPGILNYEMSDPLGPYGKSTGAHSTLCINGWNQSEADAELRRVEFTQQAVLIHARYSGGYWEGEYGWSFRDGRGRGVFGIHERVLFWVKGEYLLSLDAIEGDAGATVHNCWQMGPFEAWTAEPELLRWWSQDPGQNVLVQGIPFHAEEAAMECFCGSREPLRGWVGHRGHDAVPAPLVEFRYATGRPGGSPWAALIAPFQGDTPLAYAAARTALAGWGRLRHLELALPTGGTDVFAWTANLDSPADYGHPLASDASFAWLRLDAARRPVSCFLLDGSYVKWEGRVLHDRGQRSTEMVALS